MGKSRTRWKRASLLLAAALLLCVIAVGCESWFRSETATPLPPPETVAPTEEPATPPDESPTAPPATPVPPSDVDEYPYPVSPPETDDLPAYPEAYPAE